MIAKDFQNWLTFVKVVNECRMACYFWVTVYLTELWCLLVWWQWA